MWEQWDQVSTWLTQPLILRTAAVLVILLVVAVARVLVTRALNKTAQDQTTRYRLSKVVRALSVVVGALVVVGAYAEHLGALSVAIGVAGAGVAFALQEVIASIAGWFALTLRNFYKVGDRVQLGGIKGDVIDIGPLRTTLFELGDWVDGDIYNGRVVRVANSFVFKEPVFNYSADFPFLWDELEVPIRHDSSRASARALLETAAEAVTGDYARQVAGTWKEMTRDYVLEPARVTPLVTLTADANWLTYTVRYVCDFRSRRITKDRLFEHILDAIDAAPDVQVATTAQEVTLVRAPQTP